MGSKKKAFAVYHAGLREEYKKYWEFCKKNNIPCYSKNANIDSVRYEGVNLDGHEFCWASPPKNSIYTIYDSVDAFIEAVGTSNVEQLDIF